MSEPQTVPNPGSDEAIKQGCTCPVEDNGHGAGRGGDGEAFGWWMTEGCPLHAAFFRRPLHGSDQGFTGDGAPKAFTDG